ncbi:hypothetical protein [Alteromonas gracilis]|uniref:hypothetical protein n=1 Tax=Alteromonas gracilis TaxID=1479524 RepID=UPI0037369D0F
MKTSNLGFAGLFSILILSACGGGGGSDSSPTPNPAPAPTPPPEPTAFQILSNPLDHSKATLDDAAKSIADASYTGETKVATADINAAQDVYIALFGESTISTPYIGDYELSEFVDNDGTISGTAQCHEAGSVKYAGKIDPNTGLGTMIIDYDRCNDYNQNARFHGKFTVVTSKADETGNEVTTYFTSLSIARDGDVTVLNGMLSLSGSVESGYYTEKTSQHLTASLNGKKYKITGTSSEGNADNGYMSEIQGSVYVASKGKLDFSYSSDDGDFPYVSEGKLAIKGSKAVGIEVTSGVILYAEDTNGDDEYDVGVYFNSFDTFAYGEHSGLAFSDIDQLSIPPVVTEPNLDVYGDVYTTEAIVASPGYYYDTDTPESDLTVSYLWRINGNVVEGVSDDTLPPFKAVYGDEVSVSMVVSDGFNVVESLPSSSIEISDSPMTLSAENMPDSVNAGNYVEFTIAMTDPDNIDDDTAGALISAPPGATMNDEGLLTWQVPASQLFNEQTYVFTFASLDESENQQTLEVTSFADKAPAFARASTLIPRRSQSFAIASTNGVKELVAANNRNVGTFMVEGNTLKNSYVYPYKLPTKGEVKGVFTQDIDGNDSDEIYVLTERGLSVIENRQNNAESVFTIDGRVSSGWFYDINQDGREEIAVLHGEDYDDPASISIYDIASGEKLQQYDVDGVSNVAFGNVDDDASIEMVTNNGYVFDLDSGDNQWLYGSGFSENYVVVGDMNGNGVDEIVGAERWENLSVYSAVSKTSIASGEPSDFCGIIYAKDDASSQGIVIASDCNWGEVRALTLTGGQISQRWNITHDGYESTSLFVGDVDNDNVNDVIWAADGKVMVAQKSANDDFVLSGIESASRSSEYFAAGWAPYSDSDERAVFVGKTYNYNTSIQILSVDNSGNFAQSDEVGEASHDYSKPVVTDYNNDGVGELFIGALDFDSSFNVVELSDNSVQWTLGNNQNGYVSLIEAADLNNDGFKDAVIVDNDRIKVFDIENQVLIDSVVSNVNIYSMATLQNGETHYIAASGYESLMFYKIQDGEMSSVSETEVNCQSLITINIDTDSAFEFACLDDGQRLIHIFELEDDAFALKESLATPSSPNKIIANPSTDANQSMLSVHVTEDYDSQSGNYNAVLKVAEIAHTGHLLWRSPGLDVENVSGLRAHKTAAGQLELQIGNESMALLVK